MRALRRDCPVKIEEPLCLAERPARSIMSGIGGEIPEPGGDPINPPPEAIDRTWPALITPAAVFADQPTRFKWAEFSRRSAVAATLLVGSVKRVAISRARAAYCGPRMVPRSATSDLSVAVDKRRAVPTFSRLT